MNNKWVLISFGTLALGVSLYWGISGKQWVEPWTAVLSAMLYIMGFFFSQSDNTIDNKPIQVQKNFVGLFNTSVARKVFGSFKQLNFFSIGNKQEIDNTDTPQNKKPSNVKDKK